MSEKMKQRLREAAETGTIEDVYAVFETCSVAEWKEYGHEVLWYAAKNSGPCAFDIMKFLMEQGVEPNCGTLRSAAENSGPCAFDIVKLMIEQGVKPDWVALYCVVQNHGPCAVNVTKLLLENEANADSGMLIFAIQNHGPYMLDLVKLLVEYGANPREKDYKGDTVFTIALARGNTVVADYLLSRDDFLLSDLMPRPEQLPVDTYKAHREKAISRTNELIDAKGIVYAKTVAADIEKILKTQCPEPTREDVEALKSIVGKILSTDWMNDVRVSSGDFLAFGMAG